MHIWYKDKKNYLNCLKNNLKKLSKLFTDAILHSDLSLNKLRTISHSNNNVLFSLMNILPVRDYLK